MSLMVLTVCVELKDELMNYYYLFVCLFVCGRPPEFPHLAMYHPDIKGKVTLTFRLIQDESEYF